MFSLSKIKVLIVDDSVVFRTQIRSALESTEGVEVLGVAANGKIALEKMKVSIPDLMILDLEMPELNGIETLKEMKSLGLRTKVIVFSAVSQKGAQNTLDALNLGAVDFIPKPNGENNNTIQDLLIPKIQSLFELLPKESGHTSPLKLGSYNWRSFKPEAILIGSSTGGPNALEKIFSQLQGPFQCPVFITQHMPPVFTASLATRISKLCHVPAEEGKDGEVVTPNKIYIAPGNFHMQLQKKLGLIRISLNQQDPENSVRPAVDQMFRSAASIYSGTCLGLVLTGMGKDGLSGVQNLKQSNNPIVIQDKESCIVFGMPGAIFEAGLYDSIQNIEGITAILRQYLCQPNIEQKIAK